MHKIGEWKILRVDLSSGRVSVEDGERLVSSFIGGRGINNKLMWDECPGSIPPYDPANRLIFSPGTLTGTPAPTSGRMAVTTLMPTGFIGSSGLGGSVGVETRQAGYDTIIVQGQAESPVYLYICNDIVEIRNATHLWGLDIDQTEQTIRRDTGDNDTQVLCIGRAGENRVSFANIRTGMKSAAGHGGHGAIMGAKRLKAIALRGTRGVQVEHLDNYLQACLEMKTHTMADKNFQAMVRYGDSIAIPVSYQVGLVAYGQWEQAEYNPGLATELQKKAEQFWRKHQAGKTGCATCPVYHERVLTVPGIGTGAVKCEAWPAFASRVWNTDYEVMFEAGLLCNQYGLDVGAVSNAIAFLMELYHNGVVSEKDTDGIAMTRGDYTAIVSIIHKIGRQEGFGQWFKDGVSGAAGLIGREAEKYAMLLKGREMHSAFDPRCYKMRALAMAVCRKATDGLTITESIVPTEGSLAQMWAEELCGSRGPANPDSYEKKGFLLSEMECRTIVNDALGICRYYTLNLGPSLAWHARLYGLATGSEQSEQDLLASARRARLLERAFNVIRGLRSSHDILPSRFFQEAVPSGPRKGSTLDRDKFGAMVGEYYTSCGYNQDGVPTEDAFRSLGMDADWKLFQQRRDVELKHG